MRRKLTKSFQLLIVFLLSTFMSFGQQAPAPNTNTKIQKKLEQHKLVKNFKMDKLRNTPGVIHLTDEARTQKKLSDAPELISEFLQLANPKENFKIKKSSKYSDKLNIDRYQQFHEGIKVEHGQFLALGYKQQLHSLIGEYYNLEQLNTQATLNEEQALNAALAFVGASEYAWETVENMNCNFVYKLEIKQELSDYYDDYLPKGELVILDDYGTPEVDMDLAYKFNIYASIPLSRAYVYINAHTGKVMLNDAIIKHAHGDTRYSGDRAFGSEIGTSGSFELLNTMKGGGIETRDLQGVGGIPISVGAVYETSEPFTDNDGNWLAAEHTEAIFTNEVNNDDIALDAHWGAEIVYDYWLARHGRLSYDGNNAKIFSFVHYGTNYDNAFWNGSFMTYGDGSYQQGLNPTGDFGPLTSMDVCAHEIGHAVCSHTSDLVYARESGAMNEGFSDIWAAAVENYVLTDVDGTLEYDPFGIGEQVDERDGGLAAGNPDSRALRWMDDPQAAGDPDTYGGNNWQEPECGEPTLANDQCGVHGNSGVLNKWFYLLVNGSGQTLSPGLNKAAADDGVNDMGAAYNFTGVGYVKAERIAFLTETLLTPNAKFLDARNASEIAAALLYGPCSSEQNATLAAWDAVNVTGDVSDCAPTIDFVLDSSNTTEESDSDGCNASKIVSVDIYAVDLTSTVAISATSSGAGLATAGVDFDLLTTTVDFSVDNLQTIQVEIFDDAYIEATEAITLSISGFPDNTHTITISDDDVVPQIGDGIVDVLATEGFNGTSHPTGWSTLTVNPEGGNDWKFNGTGDAAGKAYVAFDALTTPVYNQTADSRVILKSPLLDARGKNNLNVSFSWTAGGEVDAADGTFFDFGSFGYSENGTDFTWMANFAGTVGGAVPASGTYTAALPANLSNKEFYVGWRWNNDALAGTSYSFLIDDAQVTGQVVPIATAANSSDAALVNDSNEAYFYNINGEIIARVKSLGANFACVDVTVEEAGTGQQAFEFGDRAQKVFEVSSANQADPYEVTFYFTSEELASFGADAQMLDLIKVSGNDIDAADAANSVIVENADLTVGAVNGDGDLSYTATFTGFSVFTVFMPSGALPVELVEFKAKGEKTYTMLNWSTASEQNNEGFEIMRRAEDENQFYPIGWVDGHGTTTSLLKYDFKDMDVTAGMTYYYQLKQMDFDGKESLSQIEVVALEGARGMLSVFPNPTSGVININAIKNNFKANRPIEVFNVNGLLVRSIENPEGVNQAKIDMTDLPAGIYFVRTYMGKEIHTKRIYKERTD